MGPALSPIRIELKKFRTKVGLTQVELADLAGVRPATISDLESAKRERGDRRLIDLDVIEKLCRALNKKPGQLLVLVGDEESGDRALNDRARGKKRR